MIGVYCPTRGRPDSLHRFVENLRQVSRTPVDPVFVVERFDVESRDAGLAAGAVVCFNRFEPSYSNAIQSAFDSFTHRLFLYANDDFEFTPGWDTQALAVMNTPGSGVSVVGISDGASLRCDTIHLIRRSYIEQRGGTVDMGPGRVLFPYRHNYVDTEFHHTAVKRGVYRAAPLSVINHRHPDFGFAADDDTYRRNRLSIGVDAETFRSREHLWA